MAQIEVTRELLVEDAVFILQCLRQNARGGRPNGLAEVQKTLANSVTLDLGDYVAFLRRFGYLDVDARAAALQLTAQGDQVAVGEAHAKVIENVGEHFGPILAAGTVDLDDVEATAALDDLLRSAGIEPEQVGMFTDITRPALKAQRLNADKTDKTDKEDAPAQLVVKAARLEAAEGEVGQGALGRVRTARFGELGRTVAVKQWKPLHHVLPWLTAQELTRRVLAEARAQSQLNHPCVLPVLDVQTRPDDGPALVMPLAPGGSLRARLSAKLSIVHALRTGAQVAQALQVAHGASLVHTAVKPENVLFDARGNALLADFGTARLVAPPVAARGELSPRVSVDLGDGAYRAPEAASSSPFDPPVDAWSLGVLLYEMLTGQLPGRRSPLPSRVCAEVPAEIDELVDALLDDDAARRPTLEAAASRLGLAMGSHPLYLL